MSLRKWAWPDCWKSVTNTRLCSGWFRTTGIARRFLLVARLLVAQGHEPIGLAPPVRLVAEFAFRVGIRLGRWLPLGLAQFLDQAGRLKRTDHESSVQGFISLDGFPAVHPRIRPAIDLLDARWQRGTDIPQVITYLSAGEAGNKLNPVSLDTPGMVQISAARQQLIGVRTDEVGLVPSSHLLRVPGRIAVDDQRLHRIVAAADG
jgi:hypothetical protein